MPGTLTTASGAESVQSTFQCGGWCERRPRTRSLPPSLGRMRMRKLVPCFRHRGPITLLERTGASRGWTEQRQMVTDSAGTKKAVFGWFGSANTKSFDDFLVR
ncbi:hypothetical protein J1614_004506 [Plenodomus biglobosus]|nr:hypothetical protein J1614_004506 [Plenodomus biglobosus]